MQLCNHCEYLARGQKTGADVTAALVFADIRGSTRLANEMSGPEFARFIDRFYTAATDVLVRNEAIIEKLVGDQVAAIFVPGLVGERYPDRAVSAAMELQEAFGAGTTDEAWAPVGIGVHTGTTFVGVVGTTGGMTELAVLGDVPNVTARLAGAAGAGETLISEATIQAMAEVPAHNTRTIEVKGKDEPMTVGVLSPGVRI